MTKFLDKTPIESVGEPDSSPVDGSTRPERDAQREPEDAAPESASEPERSIAALDASGEKVPDLLPVTWCGKCQADVRPVGKGKCPRCGRILRNSFFARRHPVNKLRRDQILATLVDDYSPQTTLLRSTCAHLAGILEQLETLKPGSPEHQRLVQLAQSLGGVLEASRRADVAKTEQQEPLTVARIIVRAEQVIRMATLLESNEVARAVEDVPRDPPAVDATPLPSDDAASVQAPAPAPTCAYGCGSLAQCTTLRDANLATWRVLHSLDPAEIKRRNAELTAEMHESLRRHGPGHY